MLAAIEPVWQRHLGWVFEEAARAHAARLVEARVLPGDLVVGRWWSTTGPQVEVDVLGLRGARAALVGEARWQARPLDVRDVAALHAKLARLPTPVDKPIVALWGRAGLTAAARAAGAVGWGLREVLAE